MRKLLSILALSVIVENTCTAYLNSVSLEYAEQIIERNHQEIKDQNSKLYRKVWRLYSLDEIKGSGIPYDLYICSGEPWKVWENVYQGSQTCFRDQITKRPIQFGVRSPQVRQKSLHKSRSFVRWRSFPEHERSSGKDMEAAKPKYTNGKTKSGEGSNDKRKSSYNKRTGKYILSVERNGSKNQARSNLETREWIATAYAFGCTMRTDGSPDIKRRAANNKWPIRHLTIAADSSIPFDTVIEFSHKGITTMRIVGDRGSAIHGNRIDLFMETCEQARRWGRRTIYGKIVGKVSHP